MNYCTFDRFQGVWLGSVVAALKYPGDSWQQTSNWLMLRNTLAKTVLQAARFDSELIAEIDQLLTDESKDLETENEIFTQAGPTSEDQKTRCLKLDSIELILLPLIIFSGDNQSLFTEAITKCNLKSAITVETQEDILVWSYLLHLLLNNKFEQNDLNVSQIIKQVLAGVSVGETALVKKLKIVVRAWESGLSLYQLTEKLLDQGDINQTAIALSCYCFASTPQDFGLSVRRAANLNQNVAWLTTTLTATLSGAYNGVARIPGSWRAIANQNQIYQQQQQIVTKLFQTWLGIYSLENNQFSYDQAIHAVASANIIQSRKVLQIISQKSDLS